MESAATAGTLRRRNWGGALKIALALISLLYPVLLWLIVGRLAAAGWRGGLPALEPALLRWITWGLAAIAALNLATPWLRRRRWSAAARPPATSLAGLRPLLLGIPFIAAPASYGLLLYFLGQPAPVVAWFLAASFLAAAAWAAVSLLGRPRRQ